MKIKYIAASVMLTGLLVLAGGCSKADEDKAKQDMKEAVDKTTNAMDKAATEVKDKAVELKDKAAAAIQPSGSSDAQGMIDKAKSLVADKQYQPALDMLAKLKDVKLTDDQQKMVDSLKTQIQNLMSSNPAGAASGLLGK